MTEKIKSELDKIVETLVETGIVTKIILFGSHARGEETPDSDIDLCVLASANKRSIELMQYFTRTVWDVNKTPMDLLAYNQDVFYGHAKNPTSFEHEVAKEGVLLYNGH